MKGCRVIALIVTFAALVFMFPWARLLIGSTDNEFSLIAATTLGLSLGTLSLVMLCVGMLGFAVDWRSASLICAVISVVGVTVWRSNREPSDKKFVILDLPFRGHLLEWLVLGIIGLIAALIIFNATYWPFGIDDAVVIYASFGKQIAQSGQLPQG